VLKFHALRSVLAILGIASAAAVVAATLPDNAYQRFQLLDGTIQQDARWIYERTHFDPTPIDIAFLGPSRVGAGINAPLVQADLAALGNVEHVVNFSTPEEGRNVNLVFAQELFSTKHPKLIVIGVIEKPGRFGHPAYKYLAPAKLLANPGYVGNLSYFADLMYLPFRQLKLFGAKLFPSLSGLNDQFNPKSYEGADRPFLSILHLPDGRIIDRTKVVSAESLEHDVQARALAVHPPILPASLADVEFGEDRHYVREIVKLARASGTKVAFVSIPYFHGPQSIQEEGFYREFGPVINAGFLSEHSEWFSDLAHLNTAGATVLSNWLAPQINELMRDNAPNPPS
jgi:hypothetical protein